MEKKYDISVTKSEITWFSNSTKTTKLWQPQQKDAAKSDFLHEHPEFVVWIPMKYFVFIVKFQKNKKIQVFWFIILNGSLHPHFSR